MLAFPPMNTLPRLRNTAPCCDPWCKRVISGIFVMFSVIYALPASAAQAAPDGPAGIAAAPPGQPMARATDRRAIRSVFLLREDCRQALVSALPREGFRVSETGEPVDALLALTVNTRGGWMSGWALVDNFLQGIAARAHYEAKLMGRDHRILLTHHGEEWALSGRELCQDIGDNLADRLKRQE